MQRIVSEMSYPTTTFVGAGAIGRIGSQCRRLGLKRPLVVADAGIVEAGLVDRLCKELKKEGLAFAVFDRVVANPTERVVEDCVDAHLAHGGDGLIGLGGGSVLDTAKLVRLLSTHERPLSRYSIQAEGGRLVTKKVPPMIAVPTVAGSGSEVSARAAVLLEEGGRRAPIHAAPLMPDVAICDPELTVGLPPGSTAWSGLDAFSHCIEAFCATGFHPLADALAIDGIARCARSLVRAVEHPDDLAARTDLMVVAIEGAAASEKGLGTCDALANASSAIGAIRHGLASALCLCAVLELNRPAAGGRLAKIGIALGESADARQDFLAAYAIDRVRRLTREASIPSGLRETGIRSDQLPRIAALACEDPANNTNPRKVTCEDLLRILRDAF